MFKYFNEEETNEIFKSNKEFKKSLNEITMRIKNGFHAFWNSGAPSYFNIPNEISNILSLKISYEGWFCGTFIRHITNVDKDIILWYIDIMYPNERGMYRSIYDGGNVIILKEKNYFYIIAADYDNTLELFLMPITDENKDDNIYYKIEMDMAL